MLGVLIGVCVVLGLAVGSFLNVVIYRVPEVNRRSCRPVRPARPAVRRSESGTTSRSCPGCCSRALPDCRRRFQPRYPLVELAVPLSLPALRPGSVSWDLPAYLVLFAGLLALSCIDVERLILPKRIVYPLTARSRSPVAGGGGDGHWHALR